MQARGGHLLIGRWRGAPILLHWSWPLGALLLTRLSFAPLAWLGFALLTLAHELGHGWLVRRYRLRLTAIELLPFGGECRFTGPATDRELATIAWGGVAAQALVLVVVLVVTSAWPLPALAPLWAVLVSSNLWMIGLNLLPIAPLDGAWAWKLPAMWWRARAERRRRALRRRRAEAALRAADSLAHDHVAGPLPPEVREQLDAAVAAALKDEDVGGRREE
jgi:Zn-dependent protease